MNFLKCYVLVVFCGIKVQGEANKHNFVSKIP
jgi:hypothetical protein